MDTVSQSQGCKERREDAGSSASLGDPPFGGGEGDYQRHIIGEGDRRRERSPGGSGESHSPLWCPRLCRLLSGSVGAR